MTSLFKKIVLSIVGLLALITFLGSFYTIDSGEKGIVLTWGSVSDVVGDGLHLKVPFMQGITKVDVRTRKTHAPATAASSDLQVIKTEVAINYHLNSEKLKEIYTKTGLDVEDNLISPRIQEVVKAVTAKYRADKLIFLREQVKNEIETALKQNLLPYHIVIEAVQITNFDFSADYNRSIEDKQVAEQNAQKAKNDVERIKVEAQQRIETAKAEAEAIKIQTSAIKEQGGEAYVHLKAIEKWDGQLPTYTGSTVPFINLK